MAKAYSNWLYHSPMWKRARRIYLQERYYLCERCGARANTVHHKEYINPDNINDLDIILNSENFEALCSKCHNEEHEKTKHMSESRKAKRRYDKSNRYTFNPDGSIKYE